jgi:hypothetical protein
MSIEMTCHFEAFLGILTHQKDSNVNMALAPKVVTWQYILVKNQI